MKKYAVAIALSIILIQTSGCGPIHPRWRNDSHHDIAVAYIKGADRYDVRIEAGKEAVPRSPVDFGTIEGIEVRDAGHIYRYPRPVILRLHRECGSGFACWISYDDRHALHVTASQPYKSSV